MTESVLNFISGYKSKLSLLIDGEWGAGKSYYVKNQLIPKIEIEGYKVYYVSLFGLSDPNDIYVQIFSSKLSKSALGKLTIYGAKALVRFGLDKVGFTDKDVKAAYSELVDFNQCVFIFDDLERISENLVLSDVLGFINSNFIDREGTKVIFISNEEKINHHKETYLLYKEKIIGWSLRFAPSLEEIMDSILKTYSDEKDFFRFIEKYKGFVLDFLQYFDYKNLRTLIFFYDCLFKIYHLIAEKYLFVHKDILYSLLVLCFQIKEGKIKARNINEVPKYIKQRGVGVTREGGYLKVGDSEEVQQENEFNRFLLNGLIQKNGYSFNFVYFEYMFCLVNYAVFDEDQLNFENQSWESYKRKTQESEFLKIVNKLRGYIWMTNEEFYKYFSIFKRLALENQLLVEEVILGISLICYLNENGDLQINPRELIDKILDSQLLEATKFDSVEQLRFEDTLETIGKNYPDVQKILYDKFKAATGEQYRTKLLEKIDDLETWKDENIIRSYVGQLSANEIIEMIESKIKDRYFLEVFDRTVKKAYSRKELNKMYFSTHEEKLAEIKSYLEHNLGNKQFIDLRWFKLLIESLNTALSNFTN